MYKKRVFTPLEKAKDSNHWGKISNKGEVGLKIPLLYNIVRVPKSLRGFTLIEILIALTILGVGLVAVMGYLPVALDASKKAADLTISALIAKKHIEEIRAASFDDITAADAYDTGGLYLDDTDYGGFSYSIVVSAPGISNTKDIKLTVRWSFKGKESLETFETKIVKYNPT